MAKRKSKTTSSGRVRATVTEEQHNDAIRTLYREYLSGVDAIIDDLTDLLKSGDIRDHESWEEAINQAVDGSYWVIYTHANKQVMLVSDNANAFFEEGFTISDPGDMPWSSLAYFAMMADVRRFIEAEGIEPEWED